MKKFHILAVFSLLLLLAIIGCAAVWFTLFAPMAKIEQVHYVYIDKDDSMDSVACKIKSEADGTNLPLLQLLMKWKKYDENVKTGRYAIEPGMSVYALFLRLRNGEQTPVRLTITGARTAFQLAARITRKLAIDSAAVASLLADSAFCKRYDKTPATIIGLFLPNTYYVNWDISAEQLVARMQKESKAFWNDERLKKADTAELTADEVITLASIVNQESNNAAEKPTIAGLYINRLRRGMKLQADPTAKYAAGKFTARRVTNDIIATDNPYNTYKYEGLPPGPICLPAPTDIDAVLNHEKHNYLYMCAKEDFSGTHNFASSGTEHLRNARKYRAALNRRGIRK